MRRRLLFALGIFLGAASPVVAQRPSAPWRTIETAHFRVHFPRSFERWASHAASVLEGGNARVIEYVGFEPNRRIDVVVSDPVADANGVAYPFLDRPYIELWATPPDPEGGLGDFRDWTEVLVTHEFAHIVHLTRPRNRPGWLERLLPLPIGPVFRSSPRWVAEGYATLVEGALTGSGRPSSTYRAMVLRRFAIEGKLPSYAALDGTSGWLGGSMAYLVGSSYLEWLETRQGAGSLRDLWKRMASRRGGGFSAAFRGVFGRAPADLYDRFRAEVTGLALEQEKELETAGLVGGEKWQRLEGGTASPEISPDGRRLLARRARHRGEAFLAVWTIDRSESERRALARREALEREILADPNEVADRPEPPEARGPRWTLPRVNGQSPEDPRWMPDGSQVLFTRRVPDSDGVLHRDLFLWAPETGRVTRVTRLADVADADPVPSGGWAVAVRARSGSSELVRVEISSGRVVPLTATPSDPWEIWSHPRVSPDGERVAALYHRAGAWRLRVLSLSSGSVAERTVPSEGSVFGPPAWAPDGRTIYGATDSSGVWDLAAFDPSAAWAAPRAITRVSGGAFSPAPSPDGSQIFFLELTAKGVDLGRLAIDHGEAAGVPPGPRLPPLLAPVRPEPPPLLLASVGTQHGYRVFESHVLRAFSSFTMGPDGDSILAGAQGGDVVGRLDWIAAAGMGNAAGPRGGTVALKWAGWPVEIRGQLFSALERPGAQRLVARPELDSERRGGTLSAAWQSMRPWGRFGVEAWAAASRIETLEPEPRRFGRSATGARLHAGFRRTRGQVGFGAEAAVETELGSTDGASWSQRAAELRLTGYSEPVQWIVTARTGTTGGSPTDFDRFQIGGASSALTPPDLERNRVESPALPTAAQIGDRFEGGRAELSAPGGPVVLYAERWRAWNLGAPRSSLLRLEGIELRLDRIVPLDLSPSLSLYAGVARVRSTAPRFDSIRGYGGLVYRP